MTCGRDDPWLIDWSPQSEAERGDLLESRQRLLEAKKSDNEVAARSREAAIEAKEAAIEAKSQTEQLKVKLDALESQIQTENNFTLVQGSDQAEWAAEKLLMLQQLYNASTEMRIMEEEHFNLQKELKKMQDTPTKKGVITPAKKGIATPDNAKKLRELKELRESEKVCHTYRVV